MALTYLWIAVGGAIGSILRFWISSLLAQSSGETFPIGTLIVNVSGSLVIGLFVALAAPEGRWLAGPSLRAFFMIGLCGGYTTFSSFSLQTLTLMQEGQWVRAALYTVASVLLCLAAVWLGQASIGLLKQQ
jgi:CrcB protein